MLASGSPGYRSVKVRRSGFWGGGNKSRQGEPTGPLTPLPPPPPAPVEMLSGVGCLASLRSEASGTRPGSSVLAEVGGPEGQDSSPGLGEAEQGTDAAMPWVVGEQPSTLASPARSPHLPTGFGQGSHAGKLHPRPPLCPSLPRTHPSTGYSDPGAPVLLGLQRPQVPSPSLLPPSCMLGGRLAITSTPTQTHAGRQGQERLVRVDGEEEVRGLNKAHIEQISTAGNSFRLKEKSKNQNWSSDLNLTRKHVLRSLPHSKAGGMLYQPALGHWD